MEKKKRKTLKRERGNKLNLERTEEEEEEKRDDSGEVTRAETEAHVKRKLSPCVLCMFTSECVGGRVLFHGI